MRKVILLKAMAAVAFWSGSLWAQSPDPAPASSQTQVQKGERIHVPDAQGKRPEAGQGQQNRNGQEPEGAAKGKHGEKRGPAGSAGAGRAAGRGGRR